MIKILSIGNSFSQDATRYLHKLSLASGKIIKTVNLYIGGCSLEKHYNNMLEDERAYSFEYNGDSTGINVSIKEALMSDEWDYITLQQVSGLSVKYETYQPYLNELCGYVKKYCPQSKILIHQTWAYEEASELLCKKLGYKKAMDMYLDLNAAYQKAAEDIGAEGIIPCGEVVINALEQGVQKMHRDTLHASLGIGRYALALTWHTYLTGENPDKIEFNDFDEDVDKAEIEIIKKVVKSVISK